MNTGKILVDLDDFCDEHSSLDLLEGLKLKIPQFKVTLFTIPMRTSSQLMERMKALDWVDLVPHGFNHRTNRECEHWVYRQMADCIYLCEQMGFTTHGFKAPGWQISDACYYALRDLDYWVADQPWNEGRWVKGLKVYTLREESIHGHTVGPSEARLENLIPLILENHKDAEFGFIRDAI